MSAELLEHFIWGWMQFLHTVIDSMLKIIDVSIRSYNFKPQLQLLLVHQHLCCFDIRLYMCNMCPFYNMFIIDFFNIFIRAYHPVLFFVTYVPSHKIFKLKAPKIKIENKIYLAFHISSIYRIEAWKGLFCWGLRRRLVHLSSQ